MPETSTDSLTPMMQQYLRAKKVHPEAILFFRMGDFYEMFYEDAKLAARVLGLALTSRSKGDGAIPMAGVPVRSHTRYLMNLIRAGHKVAVCDQIGDPELAEGLVDREIVRLITSGTLTEDELLQGKESNFIAALAPAKEFWGLAWAELSTGNFSIDEIPSERLLDELARVNPAEILLPESFPDREPAIYRELQKSFPNRFTTRPDWSFLSQNALNRVCEQFHVKTLEGFGIESSDRAIPAAGALLDYLRETQKGALPHFQGIEKFQREDKCLLDRATRACLELTETLRSGGKEETLLSVLDRTQTPMGGRLLRDWVLSPLRDPESIRRRQACVALFVQNPSLRGEIRQQLKSILDLERLLSKLSFNRGNARDLVAIKNSLDAVPGLRESLKGANVPALQQALKELDSLDPLREKLGKALLDEAPLTLREGGMIREGFSPELDEIRNIGREGKDWIARFQAEETQRTGISSLKVGYNSVFGYYIEITHANSSAVPSNYIRKQTLKNAERYITPELKEFEHKVLKSEEISKGLEYKIFIELRNETAAQARSIQKTARAVATIDCLASLAETAAQQRYVAPEITETRELRIVEGRHPVLERTLTQEPFVPNDIFLDPKECRTVILTGPNMSGKSTYIRQIALICLMAQMGSFVPAQEARIGVVDRIFTRIGAADEIARGNSTFMVEMVETANILRNATDRSLVILDEVGRGTSTFDGLAIAWAVAEYIHNKLQARALFATHYHQLTDLANRFEGIRNFNVAVRELGEEIVFLHKIVAGGTDRSYGIHVAQIAGVPSPVLQRARDILHALEQDSEDLLPKILATAPMKTTKEAVKQLDLFTARREEMLRELRSLKLDEMTPLQALQKLKELQGDVLN